LKNLFFFSSNKNKIIEIKKLFKNNKIKIFSLYDFPKIKEPKETGKGFADNAKIKSLYSFRCFGMPSFADDSGICIRALNNKPGIHSRRFFEKFKSKKEVFNYIINKTYTLKNTSAFFKTSICLTLNINYHILFEGKISGHITNVPKGKNGFGYDPIFVPNGQVKTFAEMSDYQKNSISHRSIAIDKLKNFIFN